MTYSSLEAEKVMLPFIIGNCAKKYATGLIHLGKDKLLIHGFSLANKSAPQFKKDSLKEFMRLSCDTLTLPLNETYHYIGQNLTMRNQR